MKSMVTATKKTKSEKIHVTADVINVDVTWEDILWQMLSCCGLTFLYV